MAKEKVNFEVEIITRQEWLDKMSKEYTRRQKYMIKQERRWHRHYKNRKKYGAA